MTRTAPAICSLLLAALCAGPAAATTPGAAIQSLLKLPDRPSESPYIYVERDGNAVRGVIASVIPKDTEYVMNDIILCYGDYPDWFPLQTEARYVSEVRDDSGEIYGAFTFPWPIGTRNFRADIKGSVQDAVAPTVYRIDFAHQSGTGNIAMMHGYWLAQPYGDDSTLVVYDATIDFNTWVPSFLMARGTRQFLPAIMDRMKKRSSTCADPLAPRRSPDNPLSASPAQ